MKLYDLTQKIGVSTPPWPTYEPLELKYFKRLSTERVNGQIIKTSNHIGTHLDGERHFWTAGRDMASVPLEDLFGEGVIVDLSDAVEDYDIYTSEMIEERVDVKEGDILIINTGYHKYGWDQPEADEERYFMKHPGPNMEFAFWAMEKKLKWIGVDCGSADHPMNTVCKKLRPDLAKEAEEHLGAPLDEVFSHPESRQLMHTKLFPEGIIHAENIGGEIDELLNQRVKIGFFPWKGVDLESSIGRCVAFVDEE
ncbi:MAG TPA: cyclase family protein [Halanaerobiales bacterium]|nr:cyclase family protein [Halanaerobiales bacterium]